MFSEPALTQVVGIVFQKDLAVCKGFNIAIAVVLGNIGAHLVSYVL